MSGVVLAGPAGVGKTRVALECLRVARQKGLATDRVTATRSAAMLPLGAFAPLLPTPAVSADGGFEHRADLLRRSAAALEERAGGHPLLLLVDDAHLLDDVSAALIHQLVDTRSAFVLATIRSGEPAPDPVMSLWKDGLAERLELTGLPAHSVKDLLAAVLGGTVDRAAAAQLAVLCQGNVLFLRELVLGALHDGTLRDEGGIWRLIEPPMPSDRLVELVESRLSGLQKQERSLLEVVSFAEPVGPAELAALCDLALVEDLERRALLSSRIDGRRLEIRLAHPVHGDVLRAGVPAVRVQHIARVLAEVVEGFGTRRREDTLRVATWRLTGGGGNDKVLLDGAMTARQRGDFGLGEQLARAAVVAGGGFDALLLAAQSASRQGGGEAAEVELAALAAEAGNDAQRCSVAHSRLDNFIFNLGRLDEGRRVAEEAEATISDPTWRDEITARRSWLEYVIRGPRAAAEAAAPVFTRGGGKALVWACIAASHSAVRLGRLEEAMRLAREGYDAQLALPTPLEWRPWIFTFVRGEALATAGRLGEAAALATREYQEGLSQGSQESQAWFAWQLCKVLQERGRVKVAAQSGREAVALFRHMGRPLNVGDSLVSLATALALGGNAAAAVDALRAHVELRLPIMAHTAVDLLQARAWVAVASNDHVLAAEFLEQAVRLGEETGDLVGAVVALHHLARLGLPNVSDRLAALGGEIGGEFVAARVAHGAALERADPDGLQRAAALFEDLGADLLAAEASADAAVAWRRAGHGGAAGLAELRAGDLIDRCEGATTPALRAIDARVRLTRAERGIAFLAATGKSNKQIAAELGLSSRTVENHLHHVYEKLGLASREELAAAFDLAPPLR